MIERFNRWYENGINPNRGWPGDTIQLGYWAIASGTFGILIDPLNKKIVNSQMDEASKFAFIGVEIMGILALVSAGGFITKRLIDRLLPESFDQKPGLLVLMRPHIRKLLG